MGLSIYELRGVSSVIVSEGVKIIKRKDLKEKTKLITKPSYHSNTQRQKQPLTTNSLDRTANTEQPYRLVNARCSLFYPFK